MDAHYQELRRLLQFGAMGVALTGSLYLVPAAEAVRPWLPGEPVPVLHLVTDNVRVQENARGELMEVAVAEAAVPAPEVAIALAGLTPSAEPPVPEEPARIDVSTLPARPPVMPVALTVPKGALDRFYGALAAAEDKEPGRVVRVLHWGDSTIAADGIAGTVRSRLVARFGDGGPGFLAVAVDPQWSLRPGITRVAEGEWQSFNLTFGGAPTYRYGLAGIVSTAATQASATLGGPRTASGRLPLARADLYYQAQPGGGTLSAGPRGGNGVTVSTASDKVVDRYKELKLGGGSSVWLSAAGDGPVTVYGVALETAGPGITWETFGVAGSSIVSLKNQGRGHLAGQVRRRAPDLVVYMTGGNEVGYPALSAGEGEGYADLYRAALKELREGAPDASCLVVGPLDQARRERGEVQSKPMLTRMVALQREVATSEGCAFWDARAAMGGDGGFKRFLEHKPRFAWSDLMHLTQEGLDLIGQGMADALLASYDSWRKARPEAGWKPPATEPAPL